MKKTISIFILLTLNFNINCLAQIETKFTEKELSNINLFVDDLYKNDKFSGTILIAKDDKILYQKAVGYSDKERNLENNINTKFNLASMNKMFTGLAIAQLVENGKLNYSDKLVKHLPHLSEKIFGSITIEQLLTHTAGTCDFFRILGFMDMKDTAKAISSYVNLGINEPLLFEPGARFQYSNYGYILLGAVIENITKMSYYDYVKSNIFNPAKMENTDSYESDNTTENKAIGYALPPPMPNLPPISVGNKIVREVNTPFIEVKGTSAGGGYSTTIDLHKFSMALLSGKLLSLKNLEKITSGKIVSRPATPTQSDTKYGYGFSEFYKNKIRIIGHNGGAPGIQGQLDIYPDLGYTVIVLSNYDGAAIPIIKYIEEIIAK
jgi:D-alanyl-D-alanine carboxypeptidase